jgi:CzcA family heavy metal efflux pump
MIRSMVGASLKGRLAVIAGAAVLLTVGILRLGDLPIETYPEFMPTRVEIQTEALGLSAEEVENLITNPMEQEFFNGIPWLHKIRSHSIPGLSSVELIFEPGTDPMRARQVVQERLTMTPALPAVSKPPFVIQPVSSTNRLMMIGLSSTQLSPIDLSVLARWTIRPRLLGVPGVAEVAIWGLRDRQLQVLADPQRLRRHGVSLDQVIRTTGNALWASPLTFVEASTPGTGGFIDTTNQRIEIQHTSPIKTAKDLAQVAIEGSGGKRLRLGDVAEVVENHQPLIGDASVKGDPSLLLVVERFPGTSVGSLTRDVEHALDAMRPGLAGVDIDTNVFRPATFLETALRNLATTSLVGLVLLALVLGAMLFDWRATLISLVAISSSLAAAMLVLHLLGVTFNLMILAGLVLALAVVVDDAVVDVDNFRRRLRERQGNDGGDSRMATIVAASWELRGPLLVATAVIALSVLPLLSIGAVTGSILRPLALTYALTILASMVVALTVTPALAMVLLAGGSVVRRESPLARRLEAGYAGLLARLLQRPAGTAAAAAALVVAAALALLPQLGGRALTPTLKDMDLLIHWEAAPGASLPEMSRIMAQASRELRSIPGVRDVGAHIGRASNSDLVVGVNAADSWVSIDPAADYDATAAAVRKVADGYPGLHPQVLTHADQRLRQVAETGTEEPLVVRVYGRDYPILRAKAEEVAQRLSGIRGVVRPRVKLPTVEPTVEVEVFIDKAARHGLKPGDVRRVAATLLSGITAGSLFEQQKVFDVVVWSTPPKRHSLTSIHDLPIDTPDGGLVRLGDVADVRIRPNPNDITHDAVSRSVDVVAEVDGRSLGSVTREVDRSLRQIAFPLEHHAEVLGEPAQQQRNQRRTLSYFAAAAVTMFFLLHAGFGSWGLASLLVLLLPFGLAGAVIAAALGRHTMPAISLMGLLPVLAIAVRAGMLQIGRYQRLERHEGEPLGPGLVLRGSRERFRPTITAALATGVALAPLLVAGGAPGLEVMRPLATIVLGGLLTTTLLVLFVLPALYLRFAPRPEPTDHQPDATRTEGRAHAAA